MKFSPITLCLIILTLTIPLVLVLVIVARLISGQSMAPESALLLADLLKVLTGGVLGLLGGLLSNKKRGD